MKPKKIDLTIIITIIILIDLFSTVFYISRVGFGRLHIQIIRLSLAVIISYYLYQERLWARWVTIILASIGAIVAIFTAPYIEDSALSILMISFSALFIMIAFYLLKRKGWKRAGDKPEITQSSLPKIRTRKVLMVFGFAFVILVSGDILFYITNNGVIANWGSLIIPSFSMGILWKHLFKDNLENNFAVITPLVAGVVKVLTLIINVKEISLLAIVVILYIYPLISYVFLRLGIKIAIRFTPDSSD